MRQRTLAEPYKIKMVYEPESLCLLQARFEALD
jgi:hypothetical protein